MPAYYAARDRFRAQRSTMQESGTALPRRKTEKSPNREAEALLASTELVLRLAPSRHIPSSTVVEAVPDRHYGNPHYPHGSRCREAQWIEECWRSWCLLAVMSALICSIALFFDRPLMAGGFAAPTYAVVIFGRLLV